MHTIVIGAGAAGSVLAARLTESADHEVTLLEAGPDYPGPLPEDLKNGHRNSYNDHDWGYRHQPCDGPMLHRFPRGRVVGGSSAVNTCIALRGQPEDYDEWASLGLPRWSFRECLPFFKKLERDLDFDNEWHGRDGPIPVRRHRPSELVPWQAAFAAACDRLGFEACTDHNDPGQGGVGPHAMNKIDGQRMSAARCYLTGDVRRRRNLCIESGVSAVRLVFRRGRAVGVEVQATSGGPLEMREADRVVVCAGAINTPALLLRSGVGPKAEVERLGGTCLVDRPAVGRVLIDHPGAAIILAPRHFGTVHLDDPLIQMLLRWTSEHPSQPLDMQVQPGSVLTMPMTNIPLVSLMTCVGKPAGVGRLRFRSMRADDRPIIQSDFLATSADREMLVQGIELCYLLARTPEMRELATFFVPAQRDLRSRAEIREALTGITGSGYHPCGTCPMSAEADDGVVDERGQVYGLEGLFIADASIMPTVPSSNIHLATLMIGEKLSEELARGE